MGRIRASEFAQPILRGRRTSHHPSGRRDLNHVLSSSKKSSVDSCGTSDHRPVRVEHEFRVVTLVPTMRKPFDVLAEALISEKSRATGHRLNFFAPAFRD